MVAIHMMDCGMTVHRIVIAGFEQVNWNILGLTALVLRKDSASLVSLHCISTEKTKSFCQWAKLPIAKVGKL